MLLREDETLSHAVRQLTEVSTPGAPVVDAKGRFLGTVTLSDLLGPAEKDPDGALGHRVDASAPTSTRTATVDQAIDALPEAMHWLTVLDDTRQVCGIVAFSDVVRAYHRALRSDARRLARVASSAGLLEVQVGPRSRLVGHRLNEKVVPDGVIVVAVRRADTMLLGLGAVHLEAGDQVTLLARPDHSAHIRSLFDGEAVAAERTTAADPGGG